jgi:rsbT antagonist protein RsbS
METIPILELDGLLLVTIQVDMHDRMALTLQDQLAQRIVSTQARGVLIDITALDTLDTFIGRVFGNIGSMSKVLGATTVLVGMRPAVAMTLVELGMRLDGVHTAIDIDHGITLLRRLCN